MVVPLTSLLSDEDAVQIQSQVMRFLRQQRASEPDELAQETLFRILNKMGAGLVIRNPIAYAKQVAQHVLQEDRRSRDRHTPLDFDILAPGQPASDGELLKCLESCQRRSLSRGERKLLRTFEEADAKTRERMAKKMNISRNALGSRVYQIRSKLRACVEACLNEGGAK